MCAPENLILVFILQKQKRIWHEGSRTLECLARHTLLTFATEQS